MTKQNAIFSQDKKHRYFLSRVWNDTSGKKIVLFIMLNPSIADQNIDDPTIRRIKSFSVNWGYDGVFVVNLNSYITSNPLNLVSVDAQKEVTHHFEKNFAQIKEAMQMECVKLIVCAYGNNQYIQEIRIKEIYKIADELKINLYCIKKNKDNSPAHPLYLKSDLKPTLYRKHQ